MSRYTYAEEEIATVTTFEPLPFYNGDMMSLFADDAFPEAPFMPLDTVVYVLVQDDADHWCRQPWRGVTSWDEISF